MEGVAEEGAVQNAAAQGQLVGVLDFVAHAYAACQRRIRRSDSRPLIVVLIELKTFAKIKFNVIIPVVVYS